MIPAIERLGNGARTLAALGFVLSALQPVLAGDEIFLLSTRSVGTVCHGNAMSNCLLCEQYLATPRHEPRWKSRDWRDLVSDSIAERPTVIYIHGNRVARGKDRLQGMQMYRSMARCGKLNEPIRFIIWSWPSTPIPGPIKDYQAKAHRTRPAAWQLAWFLDQLPAPSRVSVLGYSFGARIASGAMHVLGGGSLGGLKLDQRIHPQPQPFRVALLAAAFDANWIQPGHFHGRALSQVERLVISTNQLDPIMRFYHLSNGRGRTHALGMRGVSQPQTLGYARQRIKLVDCTHSVGRNHSLVDYLAVSGKMRAIWQELLASDVKIAISR
ncbi:MAG: hypothetical protein GXP28_05470 [Planctomycetes bacterium]|nr:hypothetical protein [Planctomycetota bacterium]